MTIHAVDVAVFAILFVWVALNGQVIYRSLVITRIAARQQPPIPGPTLREWTKRGDAPDDADPELRRAIKVMVRWRGMARRFFVISVAAILALVVLQRI